MKKNTNPRQFPVKGLSEERSAAPAPCNVRYFSCGKAVRVRSVQGRYERTMSVLSADGKGAIMCKWWLRCLLVVLMLTLQASTYAMEGKEDKECDEPTGMNAATFSGLKWRGIGPALSSGRVGDIVVDPNNDAHYWVAACSGGVWKTINGGTTYKPVFDSQGSYSIGCLAMDPANPHVVWVGTGENNSQRSVSFGDGIYRTRDGGETWENLGLKESEHIGMIAIDPRDSDIVYVAAQGPLWRSGGDRGLYKTSDGGKTWMRILHISDDTGVNEVHLDPRDSDVVYCSSYQRRRHVWTLINGGPESAIYKSTDGGKNFRKTSKGLPSVNMGRIGLDLSPVNPDVVYAIVEAADDKSGFYRSTNRGETWERRSSYKSSSPQYYNEIICDPVDVDRVYSMDTFLHATDDGGKTFYRLPRVDRHVDDHAIWINPENNKHILIGCDGGVYETYDRGEHWDYKPNLPITQFYRATVDNGEPFYNVYGGTQDNNTIGGPVRTKSPAGIANEDWFITLGGDGFKTQIDPEDPNIVYSQLQYGVLVRFDRRSGERVDIKPRELPGDEPYRWNWDSPLIISPHSRTRLYFGANILFRSDDRGNSWRKVSPDLSRNLDRNKLKVFGKIQPVGAVSKHENTSYYGNLVALSESPLVEGLIYTGSDDGVIAVTEDGGTHWRRIELFPEVPDMSYVSCVLASMHDENTVYACFDNHKMGDFTPYVLVSRNRGQSWEHIAETLPERHVAYSLLEDHEKPELLFLGTEFGAHFTVDGGENWVQLKGGIPTIAVRDLTIQRRENDIVAGTFGRGFYVLDDYTPLREVDAKRLVNEKAIVFPVKPALRYIQTSRLGGRSGRGSQGASYYTAPNPPYGATFTYYLKEKIKTFKETRKEKEKKALEKECFDGYPTIDELREENQTSDPVVYLTIRDVKGELVRRVKGSRSKGIHRISWNLRYPSTSPVSGTKVGSGPLALPGKYTVTLEKLANAEFETLAEPVEFEVVPLEWATFAAKDKDAVLAFEKKVGRLNRAVQGAIRAVGEVETRFDRLKATFDATPDADPVLLIELEGMRQQVAGLKIKLVGDPILSKHNVPSLPSISNRVSRVLRAQRRVTSPPTQTQFDNYEYAADAFGEFMSEFRPIFEEALPALERKFEKAEAPWTPGRLPSWEKEKA